MKIYVASGIASTFLSVKEVVMGKVVLDLAMSLDGFIAGPKDARANRTWKINLRNIAIEKEKRNEKTISALCDDG